MSLASSDNLPTPAPPAKPRMQFPLREIAPHPTVLWSVAGLPTHLLDPYRLLRTRLLQHPLRHSSLVVTSSCPSDGKSNISTNLAGVMALRDQRILLMDCDLRRSELSSLLGVRAQYGLTSLLQGAGPEDMIFSVSHLPNLSVLLAGPHIENPVELLDSPQFAAFLGQLRSEFDYIVIDSPPILNLADFPILERLCDATAFVVRPGFTEMSAIQDSLATLDTDKFVGTVINQNVEWWLWKSSSYYGYYRGYGSSTPEHSS
jgi:polysaccharide biosynthesis transport protein